MKSGIQNQDEHKLEDETGENNDLEQNFNENLFHKTQRSTQNNALMFENSLAYIKNMNNQMSFAQRVAKYSSQNMNLH